MGLAGQVCGLGKLTPYNAHYNTNQSGNITFTSGSYKTAITVKETSNKTSNSNPAGKII